MFIDLYLSLKNPFYPQQKRYLTYVIYGSGYFIVTVLSSVVLELGFKGEFIFVTINVWLSRIVLTGTALAMIGIFYRLIYEGTNKKQKERIFYRYLLYGIFYSARLTYINYRKKFDFWDKKYLSEIWKLDDA